MAQIGFPKTVADQASSKCSTMNDSASAQHALATASAMIHWNRTCSIELWKE